PGPHRIIVQSQSGHYPERIIFDHDVAQHDQTAHNVLALWPGDIHCHAQLIPRMAIKHGMAVPGSLTRVPGGEAAEEMRRIGQQGLWWTWHDAARGAGKMLQRLDANDLSAIIGQHHGRIGASPHDRKIEDADATEW